MHTEFLIGKATVYRSDGDQNRKLTTVIKFFET